jgi:two-component system OmpR family response regulator
LLVIAESRDRASPCRSGRGGSIIEDVSGASGDTAMAARTSRLARAKPTPHVLIVADDVAVSRLIKLYLERAGYGISTAATVAQMRAIVADNKIDFVILDVVLPDGDGWSALRWLRARPHVPVMMLTGRAEPVDRVIGRELGADDYVAKPFDLRELVARLRAILRRLDKTAPPADPAELIQFGRWTLDTGCHRLMSGAGVAVHLTQHEYRILMLLARNPRRVVTRDQLMEATAGRAWQPFDRSVDVHVSNLRRKLDHDPALPSVIRTVRGAGYMFVPSRGVAETAAAPAGGSLHPA